LAASRFAGDLFPVGLGTRPDARRTFAPIGHGSRIGSNFNGLGPQFPEKLQ
jgi:hypothetical protein